MDRRTEKTTATMITYIERFKQAEEDGKMELHHAIVGESETAREVDRLMENLVRAAERVIDIATDVKKKAEKYDTLENEWHGLNSLGELQGRGLELDILCAQAESTIKSLANMRYVTKHIEKLSS